MATNNQDDQLLIRKLLEKKILPKLSKLFKKNELAFLSLEGKNEIPIRDRIAFRLQTSLDRKKKTAGKFIVKKEYPICFGHVDLAVLRVDKEGNVEKIVTLIEFKSNSSQTDSPIPYRDSFIDDMVKCSNFKRYKTAQGADVYFILFQTWHYEAISSNAVAVNYKEHINQAVKKEGINVQDWWNNTITVQEDGKLNFKEEEVYRDVREQEIGQYFGYSPSIYTCVWRTLLSNINNSYSQNPH